MGQLRDYIASSLLSEYREIKDLWPNVLVGLDPQDPERSPRSVVVGVSEHPYGLPEGDDAKLAAAFRQAVGQFEPAERYFVHVTRRGLGKLAVDELTQLNVRRQFPIEFFDRFYVTTRKGPRVADSLRQFATLNRPLIEEMRVPQRFRTVLSCGGLSPPGADLLKDMQQALAVPPRQSRLHLVNGPAGAGKTVFFNALFSYLYDRYIEQKDSPRQSAIAAAGDYCSASRPLFVIPEMLAKTEAFNLESLVDSLFQTVGAKKVARPHFDWLLEQGHITLMLDGLDEFLARQSDLFDRMAQSLCRLGSRAQIVMCVRDSLRETNPLLQAFLDKLASCSADTVQVMDLLPFDRDDRCRLASIRFSKWSEKGARQFIDIDLPENVRPTADEVPIFVDDLDQYIGARPAIARIADSPYYCELLISQYVGHRAFDLSLPDDELELLGSACDSLIEREEEKLAYREQARKLDEGESGPATARPLDVFLNDEAIAKLSRLQARKELGFWGYYGAMVLPGQFDRLKRDNLLGILAAAAHAQRRAVQLGGASSALPEILTRVLDSHYGPAGTDQEAHFRASLALRQIAFIRQGASGIDFTHEIMADFLAAKHAAIILRGDASSIDEAVGDLARPRTEVFDAGLRAAIEADADLSKSVEQALKSTRQLSEQQVYLSRLLLGAQPH